jgi:hypothetical protein
MKYILETYCECMHAKPKKRLPENVNPHHYEELIHYAMRNGKCTMEEKFYYLIRGIAEGLLPLDRLGVLAGQTQELLMKFPFLDYFCQRHNSMAEIKALSERITEEDNPFEPGSKTTMFLRLIMLRDKRARDRMSKAISRVAETLDHEDAPFFATEADWVTMLNLIDVISGSRGKVTVRGCQNTYVGFNEKFKIYAQLARLARDTGNPRLFKASDVRELADSIVSYTVFDNQMMRAVPLGAGPTGVKTSLSDANLQEAPISNPNLSTGEFRNRTRDFVFELAQRVGLTDQDIQGSNEKLIKSGLTLKEFLANAERDKQTVVKKDDIAAATENFARAFVEKICANPGELMSELIKREERGLFLDHTSDGLGVSTLTFKAFREKYPGVMSIAHQ